MKFLFGKNLNLKRKMSEKKPKAIITKKAKEKICEDCNKLNEENQRLQQQVQLLQNRLSLIKAQADITFC